MNVPSELYSVESLLSLSGSAIAVWLFTIVLGYLLSPLVDEQILSNVLKRWLGLLIAEFLAFLGATLAKQPSALVWVVAVFNGLVIYVTAVGVNAMAVGVGERGTPKTPIMPAGAKQTGQRLIEPWW